MRASGRAVLASSPARHVCRVRIAEYAEITQRIDIMSCKPRTGRIEILENADVVLSFYDSQDVDYTGAAAATFDVWQGGIGGANLLSKTLSGGDITFANDYTLTLDIGNAESGAMPVGTHYFELWVTLSGGERRCPLTGRLEVKDTRKHDA